MFLEFASGLFIKLQAKNYLNFWEDNLSGVPQSSALGPLLFNIFMCDMFLILKAVYFTGCAYDNTPFAVADNIKDVIRSLEEVRENLITWFSYNRMKLNPDKCHLLLNTKEQTNLKKAIYT